MSLAFHQFEYAISNFNVHGQKSVAIQKRNESIDWPK